MEAKKRSSSLFNFFQRTATADAEGVSLTKQQKVEAVIEQPAPNLHTNHHQI